MPSFVMIALVAAWTLNWKTRESDETRPKTGVYLLSSELQNRSERRILRYTQPKNNRSSFVELDERSLHFERQFRVGSQSDFEGHFRVAHCR